MPQQDSPAVILYDANKVPLAVRNGVAVPLNTPGLITLLNDAGTARYQAGDGAGRAVVVGAGAAGTPAGGVATVQGDPAGTPVPVSVGTLALPTGAATEATLATRVADATVTARLGTLGQKAMAASTPVVVASDQSALPVSAAALPLPSGAATEATLGGVLTTTAFQARVNTLGQKTAANSSPVVLASDQSAVPVSAASLPLPAGAATETTLGTRLADATFTGRINTLGQKTGANSTPVVLASDVPVNLTADVAPGSATITAQDVASTTTTGANGQSIVTGNPTAGSAAVFALSSWETATVQVSGSWTGSLVVELSVDGGTTYYPRRIHQIGVDGVFSSFIANFAGIVNVAACTHIRVRETASHTGTATVKVTESINEGVVITGTSLGKKVASSSQSIAVCSEQTDAFSRVRVSNPVTLFDNQQQYGDSALIWENQFTGTGAVTNLLNESTVQMTTGGTASGAKVVRQTRQVMRYQPGKSLFIIPTFTFDGGAITNVRRRVGYFDGSDGVYFEMAGAAVSWNLVSSTSGSPVVTSVAQASWNLDKLDGTGASGITLDLAKVQIIVMDLQWLGAGRIRVGFDIAGQIVYTHEFKNANVLTLVYMKTANLPIRFELENTGVASGTATLRQICTTVISEGGFETGRSYQYAGGRGTTSVTVSTRRPVVSLQAKTTGPNSVRNTGWIVPIHVDLNGAGATSYYELVLNGTLTGASFADFSASQSIARLDIAATAISGGAVIASGFVPSGANNQPNAALENLLRDTPIVYSSLLNSQDVFSVVMTSTGANVTAYADIAWREFW